MFGPTGASKKICQRKGPGNFFTGATGDWTLGVSFAPTRSIFMRSAILLSLFVLGSACGMKKQMDDVHRNAGELAKTTERVEATATSMENRLESGMIMGTQGISNMSRREMMNTLISTRSIEEKFLYAAMYFYSFEFQLWQMGSDRATSLALREQLKAEAITEFGRVLYRFNRQLRRGNATSRDNLSNSLYALVSTVERSNPIQTSILANTGVSPLNMMEIIQAGLLKADQLNKGHIARGDLSNAER